MSNKIGDLYKKIPNIDFSSMLKGLPKFEGPELNIPDIVNPATTTNELLNEHLIMIKEQNDLLRSSLKQSIENCKLLKEQYDLQVKANEENAIELRKSKNLNKWMLVVAILAVASTIVLGML